MTVDTPHATPLTRLTSRAESAGPLDRGAISVLRHAAELCEAGWCRDAFARDEAGAIASPAGGTACRFSLRGAILRAAREHADTQDAERMLARDATEAVEEHLRAQCEAWNDRGGRTADQVVSVLRAVADEHALRGADGDGHHAGGPHHPAVPTAPMLY